MSVINCITMQQSSCESLPVTAFSCQLGFCMHIIHLQSYMWFHIGGSGQVSGNSMSDCLDWTRASRCPPLMTTHRDHMVTVRGSMKGVKVIGGERT